MEQSADLAAILLGSLAHCLENGAALACFKELRWAPACAAGLLGPACSAGCGADRRVQLCPRLAVPLSPGPVGGCRAKPGMPQRDGATHTKPEHSPSALPPCSQAVRPGGLLVLELPHPSDLWGGYCLEDEQFVEAWDAQASAHAAGAHIMPAAARPRPGRQASPPGCWPATEGRRRAPAACDTRLPPHFCFLVLVPHRPRPVCLPCRARTAARRCWLSGAARATHLTCSSRWGVGQER